MSKIYDDYREPFIRRAPQRPRRLGPIIAWDLETSNIPRNAEDRMSVDVRYCTAFGEDIAVSQRCDSFGDYVRVLRECFLVGERARCRYVAWNANRFDTFFVLRAVLELEEFAARPWVAAQAGLRGARVYRRDDEKQSWDFCDGMAMTGATCSLDEFLAKFAPEHRKLSGAINFETDEFCAENPLHVLYAERDAEGLYRGMVAAEKIVEDLTGRQLHMTIGATGIRFFERSIPADVKIHPVPEKLWNAIFDEGGMRGGYVYVSRQHDGPAWQYDINQAYAAAMRDADLPAGCALEVEHEQSEHVGIYYCRIARDDRSPVPFYCRDLGTDRPCEAYGDAEVSTCITSIEIAALRAHGWDVDVTGGWVWAESFRMTEMVDNLEAIRTAERGCGKSPESCSCPSDAIGTMVKYIGCNAYGKTTERLSNNTIVVSKERPDDGYFPYRWEDDAAFEGFWVTVEPDKSRRRYHRPHIGTFITAHVRMQLYRGIMQNPASFIKSDTDSLTFDTPIAHLPVSPKRYGDWKAEYSGQRFLVVGKKCYAVADTMGGIRKAVCKGLRVKNLTVADYEKWIHEGIPPVQTMVQKLGFRQGLPRQEYRVQVRRGTDFTERAPHLFA